MIFRYSSLAISLSTIGFALASCSNENDSDSAELMASTAANPSAAEVPAPAPSSGNPLGPNASGVVNPMGTPTHTGDESGSNDGSQINTSSDQTATDTNHTTTGSVETSTEDADASASPVTSDSDTSTEQSTSSSENTEGQSATEDSASTSDAETTAASNEPEFHIYLALGQSNMQGAAHLPDEPISHPRVKVLQGQNCSEHDIRYGEWRDHFQPMIRCQEGMRQKPDGSMGPIGLSPADTFAVTMAEAAGPNVTIGIVGAAYGGTNIQAHLPDCGPTYCTPPYGDVSGAPVVNGTTPIYRWIVDLAKKAQEVGEIKGIIFHHGESNSGEEAWLTHVNTYITSLRNDLGLDPSEVPFIAGELPRSGCCANHNSLVQRIPDHVENGHWVSSGPMEDGTVLGDRSDMLHWSTFSVIEMGKRYAQKMLEVRSQ